MSRLIDADELKAVYVPSDIEGFETMMVPVEVVIQNIDDMPTVDAVPVRHGRWVMMEGELAFWDERSECSKKILHRTPYYDFCPNCGANMRKDGDDEQTKKSE